MHVRRYFCATLQVHNSPVDCATELFIPSKDSASLLVCNENNFKLLVSFFCGWRQMWDIWASTTRGKYFAQIL